MGVPSYLGCIVGSRMEDHVEGHGRYLWAPSGLEGSNVTLGL